MVNIIWKVDVNICFHGSELDNNKNNNNYKYKDNLKSILFYLFYSSPLPSPPSPPSPPFWSPFEPAKLSAHFLIFL